MIFNSWDFPVFLFFALTGYYTVPSRFRNVFVMFCGLYFYSFWSIKFAAILLFSSIVDYFLALQIAQESNSVKKRNWLIASIGMNLGILGFFKYFNFFMDNAVTFMHGLGISIPPVALHVVLPVGVSFYTFQEMSYTIDVYRWKCAARTNYFDVAAFVMFFPQLLAGPIERAGHLLGQLEKPKILNTEAIGRGLQLVLWGLFQKVVIAEYLDDCQLFVRRARIGSRYGSRFSRYLCICAPNILRLFGLHRYRARCGQMVRRRSYAQF